MSYILATAESARRATAESERLALDLIEPIRSAWPYGDRALPFALDGRHWARINAARERMAARQRMTSAWCERYR